MKSVGLLVLGLMLGVAGGYMMGLVSEPEAPVLPPRFDDERSPSKRKEPEVPRGRDVTPIETTGPDVTEVSRFVEQFGVPSREPGEGEITGTVTDGDGQPLEGVLLRASPSGSTPWSKNRRRRDVPDDTPLAEQVRRYVEQRLWTQAEARESRTDAEGRYVVAGLRDREYRIQAWLENHQLSAAGGRGWNKRPGDVVDFTARALVPLTVRVVDNFGQPVEKAKVEIESTGRQRTRRIEDWTAADPVLRLHEGSYKVLATRQRPVEMRSKSETVLLSADDEPDVLRLTLEVSNVVKGRLKLPRGDARDTFRIHMMPLREGEEVNPPALLNSEPSKWVHSYNGFAYRFEDVAAGRHLVGATSNNGRRVLAHAVVQMVEGTVVQDLDVRPPEAGEFVKVIVLGPGGKKLRDLDFRERVERQGSSHSGSADVTIGRDGSWTYVPELEPGAEASSKIWLTIMSSSFGNKVVRIEPSKTPEVTVKFDSPATLELTVRGGATHADAHRMSVLIEAKGQGFTRYGDEGDKPLRELSRAETMTLGPVSPGDVTIKLRYKGRERWSRWSIAEKEITLTAGSNTAAIDIPPLYRLTVTMPEKAKGGQVHLRGAALGGSSIEAPVSEAGEAQFTGIPAGEYRLQSWSGIRGKMVVTLPGPERLTWKTQKDNALRVRLRDQEGLLAKQGFKTDDVIVSIGGTDLASGETAVRMAMMNVMSGTPVACEVLRGGRRHTINVNFPAGADLEQDLGGWLQPTRIQK